MDDIAASDLKTILHSKRANIYYLEHCRVLVNGGRVEYVTDAGKRSLYWNIPIANTTSILLGTGTSITQAAMRELAKAGVLVGFCGGGGTPLFSAGEMDVEVAWLSPQSEYRPTEYLQAWVEFWFDDARRLAAAKALQQARIQRLAAEWRHTGLKDAGFQADAGRLEGLLAQSLIRIDQAVETVDLLTEEARLTKALFKMAVDAVGYGEDFTRAKRGQGADPANRFLDHGNYLAYGLGATACWVLGLPHGLAVLHGKTRRGGLVFDVADLVKDACILPQAFLSAMRGDDEQQFRRNCIEALTRTESLDFMIDTVKDIALGTARQAPRAVFRPGIRHMNVLLVSQCSKRALTETRRILDQFAERRGDRTWQTAITKAGLDTLRKLLRQTARKNTAVACHWIRGRDHSELLWIVGDARQFNAEGAVPTNTTASDVLRRDDENDWHSLRTIRRLAALASLLHDLGKATQSFQDRLLSGSLREKNRFRHEWVSVRVFQAFVGQDDDATWLQRLIDAGREDVDGIRFQTLWLDHRKGRLLRDGLDAQARDNKPFATSGKGLPPLAQAVAWLVLTHHRLPALPYGAGESPESTRLWHGRTIQNVAGRTLDAVLSQVDADWNEPWCEQAETKSRKNTQYWAFPHGLPIRTLKWRKRAARVARDLLQDLPGMGDCLADPFIMHVSRLALMLGDHHYSSLESPDVRTTGEKDFPLYANTRRETGELLQPLDEHLLGVELHAGRIVHALPVLSRDLPHLINHRGLKKRSTHPAFRWQDKAADLAAGVRTRAAEQGAFVVNMASTGCGKTLGNARIMNALADPALGLRCAFAIGLRTLTLQTGRSFQKDLGLPDDEVAIRVGGAANRELFEYYARQAEDSGSASRQSLLDETTHVVYEGNDRHPVLDHVGRDASARHFLAAPVLVCTVDHLTPATEGVRGGRQIVPMLRLMTGDLVLDEPDDFDLSDLPALARLVHWAGLLGARVLLSSATLPPALIQGLFTAYLEGRCGFQRNRGARPSEAPAVCCLWVDEFTQDHVDCLDAEQFHQAHLAFAGKRAHVLGTQPVRHRARLLPLPGALAQLDKAERRAAFAGILRDAALSLHAVHGSVEPHSGKRISFGLIRMANIDPLFEVALALFRQGAPQGVHIHLCVYHSQFPLFLRSSLEHQLDTALDRRRETAVFDRPDVRRRIEAVDAQDQLFIVLGSPVTEVGRDHDYDWAVVEPSSMRSLIQLAGRVWRHRRDKVATQPNLLVCDSNLKHFDRTGQPAFCRPGFESLEFPLRPHRLQALLAPWLDAGQCMPVDAQPRIVARTEASREPSSNLVDLEHVRMERQMLPPNPRHVLNATSFWMRDHARLTAFLQQAQPFRDQPRPDVEVVWLPDEDDEPRLHRVEEGERKFQQLHVRIDDSQCQRVLDAAVRGDGISCWTVDEDFAHSMADQADAMGLSLAVFAQRYAGATLPASQEGWRWHPALGFAVSRGG